MSTMTVPPVEARPEACPPDDRLLALSRDLMARTDRRRSPFGLYLFRSDEPAAELARHVEAEVFDEAFGNTRDLMADEYGPYEGASVFCCVLDHRRGLPVGALRLILPGPAGLKSLVDVEQGWDRPAARLLAATGLDFEAGRTWDIATLAVAPGYRDGLVSQALYQGACTSARRRHVSALVTILDVRVLRLVQSRLARPFRRYEGVGSAEYLDSPASLPVWSDFESWRGRVLHEDPVLHDVVFEGRGLEAAVSAPDWDAFWADGAQPQRPARQRLRRSGVDGKRGPAPGPIHRAAQAGSAPSPGCVDAERS